MTKFARCLVLAAAIAGLVTLAGSAATVAQEKKKDTKATAKDDVKGTLELNKDKSGKYRFKVVGEDGKTIMQSSTGYEKKDDALKAIETVKAILGKAKLMEGTNADEDEKEMKKDTKKDAKKKEPEKK